jgi:hypothetical protein
LWSGGLRVTRDSPWTIHAFVYDLSWALASRPCSHNKHDKLIEEPQSFFPGGERAGPAG